ncbi:hypothetical protein PSYJA_26025, partial [Pseudomonas syringae pv. japonica str. M301072]
MLSQALKKDSKMQVSKTKSSFYRRLYVAYLIDSQIASSVPELMAA